MKDNTTAKKVSKIDRLINGIEAVCNKLPPPAILFCWRFYLYYYFSATCSSSWMPAGCSCSPR